MESFKSSGVFTKQAHVRVPEGLYEEEHARKGFFGRVSQLYHHQPPTAWTKIEGELRPRNMSSTFNEEDFKNKFVPLLYNADCIISKGRFDKFKNYYRNADFDELYFIHAGAGVCETVYGQVPFSTGDYIVMPRGTTYKFFPKAACDILKIESNSEFEQPTRGIMGPNALYDQTAIFTPQAALGTEKADEYTVEIKHSGSITKAIYAFNPLSAKGWKGSVYPWRVSIYDYCPVTSHKYHMPPSAHTTFVCKKFIICSFVERPLEHNSEKVLKVPFYHSNIDYDEVLFYHKGNFFSRDNIEAGAFTFHPQGIHHGPHPKAFAAADEKDWTDEYAVMVDAQNPLKRTQWFDKYENKNYWKSWQ
jgi:homogentisate 1,2-dioxygenase